MSVALVATMIFTAGAQTAASAVDAMKQTLFNSVNHKSTPYRIPAIATLKNGEILAIADQRPCGNDVGHGDVDIYAKVSKDNGATWTPSSDDPSSSADKPGRIADGSANTSSWDTGFGDAAVVVDRESGDVLVICVAGHVVYGNGSSSAHNEMARIRATYKDGALTWGVPEKVTSDFFNGELSSAYTMFMASGKMVQSTKVKVGTHYRVYGALLVKDKGNYVVYSDNFGESWSILGGACCSSGDEAKVEELPNGDIVLSSRTKSGRYFNVFTYSDKINWSAGSWGTATSTNLGDSKIGSGATNTNGELLIYPGKDSNGTRTLVMLQSLPAGQSKNDSNRRNVSVYYKVITEKDSYSVSDFTSAWTKGVEVDNGASAYSTMTILPNGQVGFLYEDDYNTSDANGGYSNIVYVPLTLSELTDKVYANLNYDSSYFALQLATPVINPAGGEVEAGTAVTITCEGATIHYTTDGTTPTTSSAVYAGPIIVNKDMTIKAMAAKEGNYANSAVATADFSVIYQVETIEGKIGESQCRLATFSAGAPTKAPNGVAVYYVKDHDNGAVTLTRVPDGTVIPAGVGVILLSNYAATFDMLSATGGSANDFAGNLLKPTPALDFTFEANCYVLAKKGGTGLFAFCSAAGQALSGYQNHAYLEFPGASFSNDVRISFGGTTGVESVVDEYAPVVIYDLTGRRVSEMKPGNIYIVNGKKVMK